MDSGPRLGRGGILKELVDTGRFDGGILSRRACDHWTIGLIDLSSGWLGPYCPRILARFWRDRFWFWKFYRNDMLWCLTSLIMWTNLLRVCHLSFVSSGRVFCFLKIYHTIYKSTLSFSPLSFDQFDRQDELKPIFQTEQQSSRSGLLRQNANLETPQPQKSRSQFHIKVQTSTNKVLTHMAYRVKVTFSGGVTISTVLGKWSVDDDLEKLLRLSDGMRSGIQSVPPYRT